MKSISISVDISPEIMIALNENEKELKEYFQAGIAVMLFQEDKLTFGKAIQLSGLNRFEFEKALTKKNIPFSKPDIDQIFSDMEKISDKKI